MEQRWKFMAPWCRLLRRRLSSCDTWRDTGAWNELHFIKVKMPTRLDGGPINELHFRETFDKTREALALLAAVEYVNYDAWIHLLKSYCEVDVGREGEEKFENFRAWFKVKIACTVRDYPEHPEKLDCDLVRLCGIHQREHASCEYLETLQRIAELSKDFQLGKPVVDVLIPVQVKLSGESLAEVEDVVRAERMIKQQWAAYRERQITSSSLRCTFELESIGVSCDDQTTIISHDFAETVKLLVRNNVRLSGIQHSLGVDRNIDLIHNDDRETKKMVGQAMRSLFDSTRRSCSRASMRYRFEREAVGQDTDPLQLGIVGITAHELTPNCYLEGLCSAMVTNQTTKCISLHFEVFPRETLRRQFCFKWLGFGLFSRRALANSAWERLSLRIFDDLSIEDVEAFSAIVNAEHPEEELCGRPLGLVDGRDTILREGAPIRWHFDETGEPVLTSTALMAPSLIHFVRTFSDDGSSQWVDAIVPGFGRCQVRRGDLSFDPSRSIYIQGAPGLKTLEIAFSGLEDPRYAGLPNLLKTVGSSLRSLALSRSPDGLDYTVIFQYCPQLDELRLAGYWVAVALDFIDFRACGGSLLDLTLTNWPDIEAVCATLSDTGNPVAKCVRKLRVRLNSRWTSWNEIGIQTFLQILAENNCLEYFEMSVPEEYQRYMGDFRQYHLNALPQAAEPLPIESKVAFLTVLSEQSEPADPEMKRYRGNATSHQNHRQELHQDVLSRVFTFAAPPVLRRVYFHSHYF